MCRRITSACAAVETLEDLARVKSLVAEVVRDDGVSVLNADDPLTVGMEAGAGGRVMFFSMHGNGDSSEHLREHIARGERRSCYSTGSTGK